MLTHFLAQSRINADAKPCASILHARKKNRLVSRSRMLHSAPAVLILPGLPLLHGNTTQVTHIIVLDRLYSTLEGLCMVLNMAENC